MKIKASNNIFGVGMQIIAKALEINQSLENLNVCIHI